MTFLAFRFAPSQPDASLVEPTQHAMLDQAKISATQASETRSTGNLRRRGGRKVPDLKLGIARTMPTHPHLVNRRRLRCLDRGEALDTRAHSFTSAIAMT